MKPKLNQLKVIFFVLIGTFLFITAANAEIITNKNGGSPWSLVPGDFRFTPSFPDKMSRYDVFNFKTATGDFDVLKITGNYPHARYFSLSLYKVGDTKALASIVDFEIAPDDCLPGTYCGNPFTPGTDRSIGTGTFTIWLIREGLTPPNGAKNILIYPSGIDALTVMTRVYRPDIGLDSRGGVAAPTIEALKIDGSVAIPPQSGFDIINIPGKANYFLLNDEEIGAWDIKNMYAGNEVVFFRTTPGGSFPDENTEYITASLGQDNMERVAVVTLRTPPTFENTYRGGAFQGGKDVRYWSFCIGGLGVMTTPDCICDDQINPNDDGSATIVIAPLNLKPSIVKSGLNYMKWGAVYKPKLLHRHILPNEIFEGKIANIEPIGTLSELINADASYMDAHRAENWMGEYTPKGFVYTATEFKQRLNAGEFHHAF